jgi:hypothetical protein
VQIVLRRGRRQEKDKQLYIEKVLQHVFIVLKMCFGFGLDVAGSAIRGAEWEISEGKLQVVM